MLLSIALAMASLTTDSARRFGAGYPTVSEELTEARDVPTRKRDRSSAER